MSNRTRNVVAALGAAALLVPSAAVAAPGKAKAPAKSQKAAKKKVKTVMYVVKGVYDESGLIDATGGNKHTKRAGLVKNDLAIDLTKAKLVVADTNADQQVNLDDLKAGDKVVVQLRLPRVLGETALVARKVIDQTNPPVDDDATEVPATEAPAAA